MNRKAVLIVDDEADIRELLVLTLGRMGVDADAVSTIKEAKEALKRQPYDLCLSDMRLPDDAEPGTYDVSVEMPGFKTARRTSGA